MPDRPILAPAREIQRGQLTIPERPTILIRDARETARRLGGPLAYFDRVLADRPALQDAKKEGYLIALDPINVPKVTGYNQIIRNEDGTVKDYVPIKQMVADKLMDQGRFDEVLYWSEGAKTAAEEGSPVLLCVDYNGVDRGFLIADDWPNLDARLAYVKPEISREAAAPDANLRALIREGMPKVIAELEEIAEYLKHVQRTATQDN